MLLQVMFSENILYVTYNVHHVFCIHLQKPQATKLKFQSLSFLYFLMPVCNTVYVNYEMGIFVQYFIFVSSHYVEIHSD